MALSLVLASSLFACKPTDFFTEVVITPFSDVIDYDNPTKTTVNSPDATEESASLTALDWTEESEQSVAVENLVTWSANPTSTLTTHHSIYDLKPRFPGIEASDAVKLLFANTAELDHEAEADEQDESVPEATATSTGGSDSTESSEASSSESASKGESVGEGVAGEEAGGSEELGDDPGGNAPNQDAPGEGSGTDSNTEGSGEDPYGGYNGEVARYNPNDAFARVNRVEHLAVLGNDVAVMAQSIGGAGAICAMSYNAWYGLDTQGVSDKDRYKTNYVFRDVFSGEFLPDFEQSGLLWSGSGATPDNVRDIDALVAACGTGGVIVYDQRLGSPYSFFNLEQRQRLQASEIQFVPVELSTVQGMLDAAQVIGEALSESTECAENAPAMAREYINTVNNIVRSVAATNGGSLGTRAATGTRILTAYNSPPVTSIRYRHTFGYIATDSESGLYYNPSRYLDVSDIVLFGNNSTYMETPLSFWMQAAGVWDGAAHSGFPLTGLEVLWPLQDSGYRSLATFGGGRSGGALTRWLGSPNAIGNVVGNWNVMQGESYSLGTTQANDWGLGSAQIPYLIVCGSDGKTASQIKQTVVRSMLSYDQGRGMTPYSVLPYSRTMTGIPSTREENFTSFIGSTHATTSESPFYTGLAVANVVRANPTGLLGSWTEGTMESVLEAIWIADIYSKSPEGCDYTPITNMDNFNVNIGGVTCTTTREAVLQFYQYFYRCDASGVYNSIVTDEGL
jgi:hypothetical protein